ncbi:MAG TPA: hypothetical protein VIZ22_14395, partial [Candidatus Limnocylindrales bacterium]
MRALWVAAAGGMVEPGRRPRPPARPFAVASLRVPDPKEETSMRIQRGGLVLRVATTVGAIAMITSACGSTA